jgi:hypothetical protein
MSAIRQKMSLEMSKMKGPHSDGNVRNLVRDTAIIKVNASGGILLGWLGVSLLFREMSIIAVQFWWPMFSAGIGVLLILRGIMIYENTRYWSNDKGAFIGGAFLILLSILNFVDFGPLVNFWPVLVVILGVSILRSRR